MGKVEQGWGTDQDGQFTIHYDYCSCPLSEGARANDILIAANLHKFKVAGIIAALKLPKRFRDLTLESHPNSAAVELVREWQPDDRHCGLFLYGPYGTGKSGLAIGMLRALIEREPQSAMFTTAPDLLDQIRQTYNRDGVILRENPLERAARVPLIVIDDIGAERPTEWVQEKLYTLINHRHGEELVTIFTSNLTLAELGSRIGERAVWRIAEMCKIVNVAGRNLRERKAS